MEKIYLDRKDVLEYIITMLYEARIKSQEVESDLFHHNSSYSSVSSIIKNGILSLQELNSKGIINYSDEQLLRYSDITSHVNGIDDISLSLTGLKDLYKNEKEYNPFISNNADILVSRDIKARRSTTHYGNEFLARGIITPDKFKAIDLRILKLFRDCETKKCILSEGDYVLMIIRYYNMINNIAKSMQEENLDIPLREMSSENVTLDIDKMKNKPLLVLK